MYYHYLSMYYHYVLLECPLLVVCSAVRVHPSKVCTVQYKFVLVKLYNTVQVRSSKVSYSTAPVLLIDLVVRLRSVQFHYKRSPPYSNWVRDWEVPTTLLTNPHIVLQGNVRVHPPIPLLTESCTARV